MEKIRSCPKCEGTCIATEKHIDGDSECNECGYKDKTENFKFEHPTFKQYLKMNKKENVIEEKEEKGVYVGVRYNQSSNDDILEFIKKHNIPNGVSSEDIHTTLIYSRKFDNITDLNDNMEDSEIIVRPKELHVFDARNGTRCLVMKLDSEYLEERHKYLMSKYDLSYDFDEYIPHITLSYDIGDMVVPDVELPNFFRITSEYQEDLNLNWEQK